MKYTPTQQDRILHHLEHYRRISPMTALREYGIYRLAAVIHTLRGEGHLIDTRIMTVRNRYGERRKYARYLYRGYEPQQHDLI